MKAAATTPSPTNPGLVITVSEMRKLLGSESEGLSDNHIREIIITLTGVANYQLTLASSKNIQGCIEGAEVRK